MKKNRKVLIIGNVGFIGKHLTKELDAKGIEWVGYDLKHGEDTRDAFQLDSVFHTNNFDAVIHLAALAGALKGNEYPHEYIKTNVSGTQNVVSACKKYGVGKLVFYSSSGVLGGTTSPERGLTEEDPYGPVNLYGVTKVAGELLVKSSGLDYVIIRPFTVYGADGRKDLVIYKWINQIKSGLPVTFYGNGNTNRGYTYVEDLVGATVKLLNKSIKNVVLNLGGSETITLQHLYSIFNSYCEKKQIKCERNMLPLIGGDIKCSYADTKLARKLIGFSPSSKFDAHLKSILDDELFLIDNLD